MTQFLALSGSIRNGSLNEKLARLVVQKLIQNGADAHYIDLADYPFPVFNEDLETGHHPHHLGTLAQKLGAADGIFIASPEYNSSVSALLKNTIDWLSRERHGQFSKPVYAIGSVTPGALSGVMGLSHLRGILVGLGAMITPTALGVGFGHDAFDEKGELINPKYQARLDQLIDEMMRIKRPS